MTIFEGTCKIFALIYKFNFSSQILITKYRACEWAKSNKMSSSGTTGRPALLSEETLYEAKRFYAEYERLHGSVCGFTKDIVSDKPGLLSI